MTAQQSGFLKMAVPLAQAAQRRWGVPASVCLAQAILESGWGYSRLSRDCNNFFGMKGAGAGTVTLRTHEYLGGNLEEVSAQFSRYDSPADSFDDYARLLAGDPRYLPAMRVAGDPEQFAAQLALCGYSTNARYGAILLALMQRYDLTQYDITPDDPAKAAHAA